MSRGGTNTLSLGQRYNYLHRYRFKSYWATLYKKEGPTHFKAIWFYTTFVCVFSIVYLFYRIATLLFEPLRFWLLYQV